MIWLLFIPFVIYLALFAAAAKYLLSTGTWKHNSVEKEVTISVVIPCRNEEFALPQLLVDLSAQDYPENSFEVIIVDDHSSDNTLKVAEEFKGLRNIKVMKNAGKGKKSAIKTGVLSSVSELIITTDADCRTGKSWLRTIASFYTSGMPDLIISPVKLKESKGLLFIFQQLEWLGLQGITGGFALAGRPVMCNGANLAFTRKTFMENCDHLYYNIPSGDDIFLLHSIKSKPGSGIFWLNNRDADVITEPAGSVAELLRQRARWISKTGFYRDNFTILFSAEIFITVLLLGTLLIQAIVSAEYLPVFLSCFIIKSIADAFVIKTTAILYREKSFLQWLLPLQLLYPFYLAGIILSLVPGLFNREKP